MIKTIKKIQDFTGQVSQKHVGAYAAQSAYFFVLSMIPIILLLLAIIQYTPVTKADVMTAVVNLFPEQAEALCQKFGEGFTPYPLSYPVLAERCKGADLFINASVMGQLGYDEFQTFDFLDNMAPGAAVFDVNYSNPNSKLVPTALAKGMPAFKGRRMTACQGIRAISIWTGREPSRQATEALIADFEAMDQGVQEK